MKKIYLIILIVLLAIPLTIFAQETTKVYKVDKSKCIGCTICVQKVQCPTDAIEMKNGKAVIDLSKCIDCGLCALHCPVKAINEIEYVDTSATVEKEVLVEPEETNAIQQSLYVVDAEGCIGCTICVQKCPVDAISMKDGKAVIDPEKCINCGICADVCPVKAIKKLDE
ncbi:MAG TPA: 4Fe-4S dicluster domain-containing protein [Candidatus Cloacimonetes bacterium]|nr:4Fe-4S dicluster domain-containing protein [Candidatus Cloacimonadota bacterium]